MAGSEIARLKQQIDAEVEAMRRAMTGYATVARHQIIAHRFANLERCMEQLSQEVGKQQALQTVVDALEQERPTEKQTLREARQQHGLKLRQLAETAGLPLREVYQAEIGVAVDYVSATRLFEALNKLTGQSYTFEMIRIEVKSCGREK